MRCGHRVDFFALPYRCRWCVRLIGNDDFMWLPRTTNKDPYCNHHHCLAKPKGSATAAFINIKFKWCDGFFFLRLLYTSLVLWDLELHKRCSDKAFQKFANTFFGVSFFGRRHQLQIRNFVWILMRLLNPPDFESVKCRISHALCAIFATYSTNKCDAVCGFKSYFYYDTFFTLIALVLAFGILIFLILIKLNL